MSEEITETRPKKKRRRWILFVIALVVVLTPIRLQYKDGGTKEYKAILYSVTKRHSIIDKEDKENNLMHYGFRVGTEIRILGIEIFNNDKDEWYESEPMFVPTPTANPTPTVEATATPTPEPTAD